MPYIWLPIGLLLPTLAGWLLLRLTENETPVLFRSERWVAGCVLGTILIPYVIFLTEVTGIGSFGKLSMLVTQLILVAFLGVLWWIRKNGKRKTENGKFDQVSNIQSLVSNDSPWPLWQKICACVLGLWFVAKFIAGFVLASGPAYFDDTMKNWNMRGKMFFTQEHLVLEAVPGKDAGIGSYPQSVPLMKTWLAHLNGGWHEGLVNSIHILWYVAAIALLYFALRRMTGRRFALIGAYVLSSLPLYTLHGFTAYADQFLSVIIFIAVTWLFFAARNSGAARESFLRIAAIATGLLVYTKNESILLHIPPIVLLLIGVLFLGRCTSRGKRNALFWYGIAIASVLVPWLLFKWGNGLTFGNAKPITGQGFVWHEGVLLTIVNNIFMEGNWLLLPALFMGLALARWKRVLKTSLIVPTAFVLMVIAGQLPIYIFTELYVEAINQTGYARGFLHLVPLIALVTTVLLQSMVRSGNE